MGGGSAADGAPSDRAMAGTRAELSAVAWGMSEGSMAGGVPSDRAKAGPAQHFLRWRGAWARKRLPSEVKFWVLVDTN